MVMIPKKPEGAAAAPAATKPSIPAKTAAPAATSAPVAGPAAAPATTAEEAVAPAAAPAAPVLPTATAVAVRPANAVATRQQDVVATQFKDAFPVEWNTCHRLQASNGNICDVEANKKALGPTMLLELMSFQDNFQISPGTNEESDVQYVRYSNDGKTTTQGEDCAEFLAALKNAGYADAKMGHRCTLAGLAIGGDLDGELVQIDLPPTSKQMFDRFKMQVTVDVAKGKRQPDEAKYIKLRCEVTTKGKMTWTVVHFEYAYEAGQVPA